MLFIINFSRINFVLWLALLACDNILKNRTFFWKMIQLIFFNEMKGNIEILLAAEFFEMKMLYKQHLFQSTIPQSV